MLKEALRYLGVQGDADEKTLRLVSDCMETVKKVAVPKSICRRFSMHDFADYIVGNDIKNHLAGAAGVAVLAATLGISVDREIGKNQAVDMARAAVLDACAAALIETYCDENMPDGISGVYRFSPGYGDYPLAMQPRLLKAVRAEKIGITVLESHMLLPTKSVTAVIPLDKNR
ncbi:MAG: hypothetical protein IJN25_02610 [Clostridia bacterium]|nr:hypothetical protein [Oscillospiraceae bacterium]MBQ7032542.1 hypothetical protein [Clostridia bacterium]